MQRKQQQLKAQQAKIQQLTEVLKREKADIEAMEDVKLKEHQFPKTRQCAMIGQGWARRDIPVERIRRFVPLTEDELKNNPSVEVVHGPQAEWTSARVESIMTDRTKTAVKEVRVVIARGGETKVYPIHMVRFAPQTARGVLGIRKATVEPKFLQRQILKRAYPQFDKEAMKKIAKKEKETGIKEPLPKPNLLLLGWAYREMSGDNGDPFVIPTEKGWTRETHQNYVRQSFSFARASKTVVFSTEHSECLLSRIVECHDPSVSRIPTTIDYTQALISKKGLDYYCKLTGENEAPLIQEEVDDIITKKKESTMTTNGHRVLDIILKNLAQYWYSEIPHAVEWMRSLRMIGLCENLQPVRVHTYLNRILGLPLRKQSEVFRRFQDLFELENKAAVAAGAADPGMCELDGEIQIIAQAPLCQDEETGAHTKLMTLKVTKFDLRMPFSQAQDLVTKSEPTDQLQHKGKVITGIYRTVSRTPTLRVITKEEGSPAYLVWWMQNRRRHLQRWNPHKVRQIINRCEALTLDEAQPVWEEAYEDLAFDQDQTKEVHVIMGPVLSNWAKLRSILGVEADTKAGSVRKRGRLVMQFVNEVSNDGTRIIGVMVPPDKVFDLEEAFTGYSLRPTQDLQDFNPMELRSGLALPIGESLGEADGELYANPDGSWGPSDSGGMSKQLALPGAEPIAAPGPLTSIPCVSADGAPASSQLGFLGGDQEAAAQEPEKDSVVAMLEEDDDDDSEATGVDEAADEVDAADESEDQNDDSEANMFDDNTGAAEEAYELEHADYGDDEAAALMGAEEDAQPVMEDMDKPSPRLQSVPAEGVSGDGIDLDGLDDMEL